MTDACRREHADETGPLLRRCNGEPVAEVAVGRVDAQLAPGLRIDEPELAHVREFLLTRVADLDRKLRERFAARAAEERTGLVRMLNAAGVRHVALSTEGDWLRGLAAFLKRSEG